jgi:hypothetical protein
MSASSIPALSTLSDTLYASIVFPSESTINSLPSKPTSNTSLESLDAMACDAKNCPGTHRPTSSRATLTVSPSTTYRGTCSPITCPVRSHIKRPNPSSDRPAVRPGAELQRALAAVDCDRKRVRLNRRRQQRNRVVLLP